MIFKNLNPAECARRVKDTDYPFNFLTTLFGTNFVDVYVDTKMDASYLIEVIEFVIRATSGKDVESIIKMRFKDKLKLSDIGEIKGFKPPKVSSIIYNACGAILNSRNSTRFMMIFDALMTMCPKYPCCVIKYLTEFMDTTSIQWFCTEPRYMNQFDSTIVWICMESNRISRQKLADLEIYDNRIVLHERGIHCPVTASEVSRIVNDIVTTVKRRRFIQRTLMSGSITDHIHHLESRVEDLEKQVDIYKNRLPATSVTLSDMDLSIRAFNVLHAVGCRNLNDVIKMTTDDLKNLKNSGKITCFEILNTVHRFGYTMKDE